MKKIAIAAIALIFGASLSLFGETSSETETKNLQKKEQHQNQVRNEKGAAASGEKIRTEQANQGESSKVKNQTRTRARKETRAQAKAEAKQSVKAERAQAKGGK